MASNSNTKDCEMWEAEGESQTLQFSVVEQVPTEIYGDETRQFTVQATSNGPDLFLRIATIRSGPEVLQFTVVSANRQDLALLDDILADTAERLGY